MFVRKTWDWNIMICPSNPIFHTDIVQWKWLKLPVISQLYSDHRNFCYGAWLRLQLSFRWLRNILDFSDGFTQQCRAGPTLVRNILKFSYKGGEVMRRWQRHQGMTSLLSARQTILKFSSQHTSASILGQNHTASRNTYISYLGLEDTPNRDKCLIAQKEEYYYDLSKRKDYEESPSVVGKDW